MIIAIVAVIIVLLVILLAFLLQETEAAVLGAAVECIADAEKLTATGPAKMSLVVSNLATLIPPALRKIFTDERLQNTAQEIFVWMRKYAEAYSKASQAAPAATTEAEINAAALEDVIAELLGLGMSALKEKAAAYGLTIPDGSTEKDIALALISAVMEKR